MGLLFWATNQCNPPHRQIECELCLEVHLGAAYRGVQLIPHLLHGLQQFSGINFMGPT